MMFWAWHLKWRLSKSIFAAEDTEKHGELYSFSVPSAYFRG